MKQYVEVEPISLTVIGPEFHVSLCPFPVDVRNAGEDEHK